MGLRLNNFASDVSGKGRNELKYQFYCTHLYINCDANITVCRYFITSLYKKT
jgi:hypothetical protein